jgi:hypothetical protein
LIFLVKESVECDTVSWWVERYNIETSKEEFILIQDFGMAENKLNKRILEEYDRAHPSLVLKHLNAQQGYEGFRWTMFFNDFDKVADMLKQADSYKEMLDPYKHFDIKRYVIEWEMTNDSEPRYVYHDGPFSLGTAQSMMERSVKDTGMVNVSLKEVPHNKAKI